MPGGTFIVCGDDSRMEEVQKEFAGASVSYGLGEQNNLQATDIETVYEEGKPSGVRFIARLGDETVTVTIFGALGRPRVYAALAALAANCATGGDLEGAAKALADWEPPQGRLRLIGGVHGSLIIDDTYNSSPAAALAALDALQDVQAQRRICVLGDMLELGKYSAEAHRNVGTRAAAVADMLITVGFRARAAAQAALDAGMPDANIRQYEMTESRRAGKELEAELREGDVVLVKGSQSMRMERTVEEIMAEPQRASELLVRQEDEWKARE